MRAGSLTEHITLLKPDWVKTETGSEYNTYTPVHKCRAKQTYSGGDRVNENGDIFYSHRVNFEIRRGFQFLYEQQELYRIEWNNRQYRIICIEEDKHNQSIKITCSLIND